MLLPTSKIFKLNYGQLDITLKKLGYTAAKATGGHIVYKHAEQNSLLAIRHSRKTAIVPKVVVASIFRNVINTNVANESDFRKIVAEVA